VLLALALLCVLTVCSDILPADIMEAVLRPTNCSVYLSINGWGRGKEGSSPHLSNRQPRPTIPISEILFITVEGLMSLKNLLREAIDHYST